jgi:hypothetical protein
MPADSASRSDAVQGGSDLPDPSTYTDRQALFGSERGGEMARIVSHLVHSQLRKDIWRRGDDLDEAVIGVLDLCVDQFGVAATVVTLNTNYSERPIPRDLEIVAVAKSGAIVVDLQHAIAARGMLCVADAHVPTHHIERFDRHATGNQQTTVVQLLDAGGAVFAQLDSTGQSYALDETGEWKSPMTPELFWTHAEFLRHFH